MVCKAFTRPFATQEALAADYFRFLVGESFSPEVRAFCAEDGTTYVISRFNQHLTEISSEGPLPLGLSDALAASYLIDDGDCLLKNIKVSDGNVFRIDFGAALHYVASKNMHIPFLSFFGDLRIGFESKYLHGRVSPEEIVASMLKLCTISPDRFRWKAWKDASAGLIDFNCDAIQTAVSARSHLLMNHIAYPKTATGSIEPAMPSLVEFYRLLDEEKRAKGNFPLFDASPEYLAHAHQQFYREQGAHPDGFLEREREAHNTITLVSAFMALGLPASFAPTALDHFLAANPHITLPDPSSAFPTKAETSVPLDMGTVAKAIEPSLEIPTKEALRNKYSEFSGGSFVLFSIFAEENTVAQSIEALRRTAESNDSGASAQTLRHFRL